MQGGKSLHGGESHYGGNTVYHGGKTPGPGPVATPSYYPQSVWGGGNDFEKDDGQYENPRGSEHYSNMMTAGNPNQDAEMRP